MRILCMLLFCAVWLFSAPSLADWSDIQNQVAQTDRDFHARSLKTGGAAWGEFAASEARLAAGTGKEEIAAAMTKAYARPGFHLDWQPDRVEIFADLAVSSGRYQLRSGEGDAAKTELGRYVTVWRRQNDGSWRYVWDGGTPDPVQ